MVVMLCYESCDSVRVVMIYVTVASVVRVDSCDVVMSEL